MRIKSSVVKKVNVMHPFVQNLQHLLTAISDAGKAVGMRAYMKDQFDFLGIQTPARRTAFKQYMKEHQLTDTQELEEIVEQLWRLPEREYQYCAIELLAFYKKLWPLQIIELFEYCVTDKSWWDTVDFLATECLGPYYKKYPEQIIPVTGRWNTSDNIWLQRSSLLFQKAYKQTTDTELLSKYILTLSKSKEFFVQKAIGWILREYAKTNTEWVKNFVASNELAALSKREALKHLS